MVKQRDDGIAWCDETWSPIRGCSRVSEGCRNCFAERIAARFSGPGLPYEGFATMSRNGPRWTGEVRLVWDALKKPVQWKRPRRIFVNPMSDLFHDRLTDRDIDEVFGAMWACRYLGSGDNVYDGHTFMVLTKRPLRMLGYLSQDREALAKRWANAAVSHGGGENPDRLWDSIVFEKEPHPRIWLGVSCEDQATAYERIPPLMKTPAAVRFVSAEPLLGRMDLSEWVFDRDRAITRAVDGPAALNRDQADAVIAYPLNWVIIGCESGPGARPMQEEWARSIKNQCVLANVPCFFKQAMDSAGNKVSLPVLDGKQWIQWPEGHHG